METLKIYLNIAFVVAVIGYCLSWIYEKLSNQQAKANKDVLLCVWAKVVYDDGTELMFQGKFFAEQQKYSSTYLLKVEAELVIIKQLQRIDKHRYIYDILFINKTTFESELKLKRGKIQFVDYKGVLKYE